MNLLRSCLFKGGEVGLGGQVKGTVAQSADTVWPRQRVLPGREGEAAEAEVCERKQAAQEGLGGEPDTSGTSDRTIVLDFFTPMKIPPS